MKKSILLLAFTFPFLSIAQQHPLPVESAVLLEPGHAQIDLGASYFSHQPFPLSGLQGSLTKIGNIKFSIALSEFVELQTDGTLLNILRVQERKPAFNSIRTTANQTTADIGDFSLWTKFVVVNENTHGFGFSVRFGIQLPNASNESGLGIDEMNFFSSFLLQKYFAGHWTVNTGLGIIGDPTQVGSQHDVFIYGIEYAVPLTEDFFLRLQNAGRIGHNGVGVHRLANGKIGMEKQFGGFSLRLFGVSNYSPDDNARGVELTLVYLFHVVDMKK